MIMANHQVIAFKSCYPASAIGDDDELNQRYTWYSGMRDFFDDHPEKTFVVMSTPPIHPDETNANEANRARAFADWLKSPSYLEGYPNVVCFDLFDLLASDGSDGPINTLRTSYQQEWVDSHPNELANQTIAPLFAQFLIDAGLGS
jgi:hypothetical protein